MDILQKIDCIPDPVVADKTRKAIQVLCRTFALYPPDKIAFSFNGGKDSTVLLHLLRAAISKQHGAEAQGLGGIHSFYFQNTKDFSEVKDFVEHSDAQYKLGVDYIKEPDFKRGLCDYLAQNGVMAIVLGTRRGDPNGNNQDSFCPSSEGWPPFMRVNPIIDWTYHDVWVFLRSTHVMYCSLYDNGYTSLGGTGNTLPNSALRRPDGSYEPAYKLADGRLERIGRVHPAHANQVPPHPSRHARPSPQHQEAEQSQHNDQHDGQQQQKSEKGKGRSDGLGEGGASDGAPKAQWRSGSGSSALGASVGLTHSAAIVIIGDELLSGKVDDVNAVFLCRELRALGWQVTRVVFIPDDVDEIASTVRALSAIVQVLITAGGIGPTLDDVTMQGIARAVGQPLVRLPALVERLVAYFGSEEALTPAHLKLAEAPQHSELIDYTLPDSGQASKFPLLRVNNIYVLPGVPSLLVQKWTALKPRLQQEALAPFHNAALRLSLKDETTIAPALNRVSSAHGLDVMVGSYPVDKGIIITLESKDSEKLEAAVHDMQQLLPGEALVAVERDVDSF